MRLTTINRRAITQNPRYLSKEKKIMTVEDFIIPEDYREPSASDNYLKLKNGETRIRILSNMVMGWEEWSEGEKPKPIRYRYNEKPDTPINKERPIKLFWAFVVWNYELARIQILHVTQASIRKALYKIVQDADWGNPVKYDLKMVRQGEELKTVYSVIPIPPSPLNRTIGQKLKETPVNLEALFTGQDPFEVYTPTSDNGEEECAF